jgi:hypothetical protein
MNRLPIALALLVAAAGCGYKPVKGDARAQDPAYVFPHAPHVEGDVACNACHADIEKADRLEQGVRHVKIPANPSKNDACSGCHDTDPKLTLPKRTRPFRISFSHADHLGRVKDCGACHKALPDKGDAVAKTPPMDSCTACHNHQADFNEARCMPCHTDLKGYAPVSAFRHEGDWLRAHGPLARPTAESCAQCHDQTYCAECHAAQTTPARPSVIYPEAVGRTFIHRGDYVSRHMIEARANGASCRRCHGSQFCDACHEQQGVSDALRLTGSGRDPHPPNFFPQHGDAARRDITSCAGCHDNGARSFCVECHGFTATGGLRSGGNPHPPSWTDRHDRGDIADNDMCKVCHGQGTGAPALRR